MGKIPYSSYMGLHSDIEVYIIVLKRENKEVRERILAYGLRGARGACRRWLKEGWVCDIKDEKDNLLLCLQ